MKTKRKRGPSPKTVAAIIVEYAKPIGDIMSALSVAEWVSHNHFFDGTNSDAFELRTALSALEAGGIVECRGVKRFKEYRLVKREPVTGPQLAQ